MRPKVAGETFFLRRTIDQFCHIVDVGGKNAGGVAVSLLRLHTALNTLVKGAAAHDGKHRHQLFHHHVGMAFGNVADRSVTADRELNKIKEARWAKALRNSRERLRILWVFFYTHSPVSRP